MECFNYEDEGDEEEGMEEDSGRNETFKFSPTWVLEDQEDEEEERETDQEGKKPEEGKKKRKRRTAHEDEQVGFLKFINWTISKYHHFSNRLASSSFYETCLFYFKRIFCIILNAYIMVKY